MPLYMIQACYTAQAWSAMTKSPEDRLEVVADLVERAGGKFHQFFYSFGDHDVVVIFEAPDDKTGAAVAIAANSAGHLKEIKTTPLLTVREAMEVMRKAGNLAYKAPQG